MRSFVLILVTVVVLGGAVALYTWMQPASAPKSSRPLNATTRQRPEAGPRLQGIGEGKSPWTRNFDPKTGELSSQIRALSWKPRDDDTIDIEEPEAEFFSSDGKQRIRIEGKRGNVVRPPGPREEVDFKLQGGGTAEMPSRGKLQDVTVSVHEPVDAPEPILTARMNNIAFDVDTFRIATESYKDPTGKTIEADQVPVTVRGKDYDFDGQGLIIRWNERDRKLQLLEIAHGESMVVKNPDALKQTSGKPTTQQLSARPLTEMYAATDDVMPATAPAEPKRRRRASTATAPSTQPEKPVIYRATFDESVRIFEGEATTKPVAILDQMAIDLHQEDTKEPAASQPSTQSTTRRARRPAATTQATSAPSSKGPIVVKWTGKLRVVPLDIPPDPMPLPGKAIVRMFGSPAIIQQKTGEARCGEMLVNSADNSALLLPSAKVPLVTLDAQGAKVSTPKLRYEELEGDRAVATLIGQSSADIPVQDERTGERQMLKAAWSNEGRLTFARPPGEADPVMTDANLTGDVDVAHPQMKMKSQTLNMAFDPNSQAATQSSTQAATTRATTQRSQMAALNKMTATGDVDCQFAGKEGPSTMRAQRFEVVPIPTTQAGANGWQVTAERDVVTSDKSGQMKAGRMTAKLMPSTQPGGDMEPESIHATAGVELSANKSLAIADELIGGPVEGVMTYTLIGKPDAKVVSDTSTLVGPRIVVQPDRSNARILGAGSVDGLNPDNTKQKVLITWAGDATIDGGKDVIDINRTVEIKSTEANTSSVAKAEKLVAHLGPKPTTQPAQPTAPASQPTTKKSKDARSMDFMSDKQITSGTLSGGVEITSEQFAPDGTLEIATDLRAERVDYDQITGRLDVPVPGQMVYRDARPPAKEQSKGPTMGSGRGATVFGWSKSLVYDQPKLEATMLGDVRVIHEPDNEKSQKFEMKSQMLKATFEPAPSTQPTTKPAAGPAAMKDLQAKSVVATGDVHVESSRLNLDAPQLSFDMLNQTLIATGDAHHPITVFDAATGSTQSASKVFWNTKTDEIRIEALRVKARP